MDENVNNSVDVEKDAFDCIALREETAQTCESSTTQCNKHSIISRHLQEDKSSLYSVTSPQHTGFSDDASTKENTVGHDETQSEISEKNLAFHPKQRRHGVVESDDASTDQRQRKIGIAENKDSVSDRTFLRVLHKKF